jgi:fido (protein-threonine AMPylation protein)
MKFNNWSSYFWPDTEVLKNKLNIKDKIKLVDIEKISTGLGIAKIAKMEIKTLN